MYENKKCEYCGEQFAKNDDVVVCPDCGAPYHRKCWEAHGVCAHASEHGADFRYRGSSEQEPQQIPEEDFVAAVKKEILSEKQEGKHCENCGAELLPGDEYCVYCSHRQGDPVRFGKQRYQGVDPLAGMAPEERIAGEKVAELALVVRTRSAKLLPRLKRISEKRLKIGWSWPSFFFGYLYFFFRKMYKYGLVLILAQIMLFNVMNIALGDPIAKTQQVINSIYTEYGEELSAGSLSESEYTAFFEKSTADLIESKLIYKDYTVVLGSLLLMNTACALLFDYLYLRHCKGTIARMNKSAEILGEMSRSDFRLNLLARGGVSFFGLVFGYFANMLLSQLVAYLINLFAQMFG